ncbi:hypothetical protein PHABIO_163 [Pseudomonas phage Phabio]|uniref:Uncharacterized protein n=1 Tax=Pseudomonas phage Phabio TaxID=2006668 RepID=A0A1Y0SW49_9CAUD|nr:hypothetical protein MZD05_gp163 [Pseudomonas phage Phabio]ARV76794.1 hypothetical protein PHABIO_163 [Pseudomonas phage Phabio]
MTTPTNPFMGKNNKLVYHTRKCVITACKDLMPDTEGLEGKFVMVHEIFVHDEWHSSRSSLIVGVEGNDIETRNSVYRVIDDSNVYNPLVQEV